MIALSSAVVAMAIFGALAFVEPASASPTLTAPLQQAQAISQHLQRQRSQSGPPKAAFAPPAKPIAPRLGSDLPAPIDTDSAPKLRRAAPAAPAAR